MAETWSIRGLVIGDSEVCRIQSDPKEFPDDRYVTDVRQLERVVDFLEAEDPRVVDLSADSQARSS
jgi:hypothetical protein